MSCEPTAKPPVYWARVAIDAIHEADRETRIGKEERGVENFECERGCSCYRGDLTSCPLFTNRCEPGSPCRQGDFDSCPRCVFKANRHWVKLRLAMERRLNKDIAKSRLDEYLKDCRPCSFGTDVREALDQPIPPLQPAFEALHAAALRSRAKAGAVAPLWHADRTPDEKI